VDGCPSGELDALNAVRVGVGLQRAGAPAFDRVGRDVLERHVAERGSCGDDGAGFRVEVDAEVDAEGGAVVATDRRFPGAFEAAVPVPLGVSEGGAVADGGDADPAAEVGQLRVEPRLGAAPRVGAGGRAPGAGPGGADPGLGLLDRDVPVGEADEAAVLRVPGGAALAFTEAHVPADGGERLEDAYLEAMRA